MQFFSSYTRFGTLLYIVLLHLISRRKDELKPQITLDHLVKERYPRFIDALRDLDDALCMVHLFASMPSTGRITAERTANCAKLVRQWQHYIAKSRTLHKVFVSVKGVYFQAEIMAEPVTWIVPHQFTQAVPKEVDVRVMLTFLEFYEVFLQFVMFKLYSAQNLQYPPKVDEALDAEGVLLLSMKSDRIETTTEPEATIPVATEAPKSTKATKANMGKTSAANLSTLPKLLKELGSHEEEDDEEEEQLGLLAAPLADALNASTLAVIPSSNQNDDEDDETEQRVFSTQLSDPLKGLFSKLVFFINREVPLEWMQLCVIAFGGKVAWDGPNSPYAVDDARITHQIVDRPQQGIQSVSREYVQPQWIFDSINAQVLLPVHNYRAGAKLPPHLSPFVDDEKEGYMPRYGKEMRKLQAQANGNAPEAAATSDNEEEAESESEGEEDEEVQETKKTAAKGKAATAKETAAANKRKGPAAPVATSSKKAKSAPVEEESASEEEEESVQEESGSEEEDEEEAAAGQKKLLQSYQGASAAKKGPKGVVFQPKEEEVTEVSTCFVFGNSLIVSFVWCVFNGAM